MRAACLHIATLASLVMLLASSPGANGAAPDQRPKTPLDVSSLRLKAGDRFLNVRSRMINKGWRPIPMHSSGRYEYDGAEKRLVERGFREVDSCSIDAGANCILYYRKAASCLRLDTIGEQVDLMKVARWATECPSTTQ